MLCGGVCWLPWALQIDAEGGEGGMFNVMVMCTLTEKAIEGIRELATLWVGLTSKTALALSM